MKMHFDKVENVLGFLISNTKEGENTDVLTKAIITSDEPQFYPYIYQISAIFLNKNDICVDSVYQFLVIIHQDLSADTYVNDFQVVSEIVVKKDITKGDTVRESDIADIRSLKFPEIEIIDSDKIIYCFKIGWKFGLFFDLDRGKPLALNDLYQQIGALYRYLRFQYVYNLIETEPHFEEILKDGWFPFIALLGNEYRTLIEIYQNKFDFDSRINNFLNTYDRLRLNRMINKWWNKQVFQEKQQILEAGVNAYLLGTNYDIINCIKNLYSEIDGIIRKQYFKDTGKGQYVKTRDLLQYVLNKGLQKSETDISLFLPRQFFKYLSDIVFNNFDLKTGEIGFSRHSVCHGIASATAYTKMKALQAILILDQIYFYI